MRARETRLLSCFFRAQRFATIASQPASPRHARERRPSASLNRHPDALLELTEEIASPPREPADDSKTLVTGSADTTCKMWDTETGVCYFTHQFEQPVRAVALSQGDQLMCISSDPFMGVPAAVHILSLIHI